jgi:hypothetical protein
LDHYRGQQTCRRLSRNPHDRYQTKTDEDLLDEGSELLATPLCQRADVRSYLEGLGI